MSINVNELGMKELNDLIAAAQTAKTAVESKLREQTRAELAELAKAAGFDIYELFGFSKASKPARATKAPRSKGSVSATGLQPKYQSSTGETWVGRGKRPAWVNAHLSGGGNLDDLLIAKAA